MLLENRNKLFLVILTGVVLVAMVLLWWFVIYPLLKMEFTPKMARVVNSNGPVLKLNKSLTGGDLLIAGQIVDKKNNYFIVEGGGQKVRVNVAGEAEFILVPKGKPDQNRVYQISEDFSLQKMFNQIKLGSKVDISDVIVLEEHKDYKARTFVIYTE